MIRSALLSLLTISALALSGCTMGASPDESYTGYGGLWERTDPYAGRVGSQFTPAAGQRLRGGASEGAAGPTLAEPEVPGGGYGELPMPTDSDSQ